MIIFVYHPIYLNDVLHVNVEENGLYTALPWGLYILTSLTCGSISDKLISSGRLSITNTRKVFVWLGKCDPSVWNVR